ncbi:hypothetical protein KXW98_005647 [Aspergillus fumigatus]|uniref:Uncharacterized protein n=1 Tax=Aspergillus fumigatus TaxID=746128 RepID=A0A8H4HPK0_ASPFM|nr:hypothetical protein CNMCM8714_005125 [Aspergillus fumigatus]KAF4260491.1 hypothetical protein CNMCM8057_002217 [Aspergillus fumigatus]KAH1273693.1 hypothetical protein KXX48_006095 [Aspergillus fumigatus]KAH1299512.1 hypothetical protein KXX11_006474 [Aspergillus fumigatus]KAH1301789.1 hypothetical protein KXX66_005214 [Aspergillus fumigatus]
MPRGTKIPKTRWSHSEKRRLLNYRDAHPDLPWEQIKLAFPGRSGTALCKQYSDLKIDREKGAQKKANNGNEETEEMTNNQNNVTNTTQLSKGNKRLLHLGDNETRPSKQTKTGDVAANSDNDPDFDPSEDSDSDGGDISPAGNIGRSPTARQLRNAPRKQLNDTVVGSASGLKRPSKSTKLQFTGQPGARNSFSTTPASPDPRTLQNAKKSIKTTELAPNSSQPTLSNSRTPDNAADTNKSDATSEIVSTVQRAPPNSSPANTHRSLPNQESTTDEHLPSKPEDKMAPRPPTPPFPATTGFTESGNNGYPLMQHGALLFVQAGFAMRDLPRERARNAQLDERNENLVMEVLKLKEKEAEWRQEIEELQLHNKNLEGDLKKQIDQNKKLEAGLKELSEKKNQGALDSANGATNAKCEHCLEHLTRINALTEENKKMKQRCKVLAEAFAAGNDQA